MEKKQGLSNVQRKMLDEIYTEQFDTLAKPIIYERREGRERIVAEIVKQELKTGPLKDVFDKMQAAYSAYEKAKPYLEKNGLKFYDKPDKPRLEIANGYSSIRHPKLKKYDDESTKIETRLATKKKEIRARVYGLDATYEEVEREIAKEIAGI